MDTITAAHVETVVEGPVRDRAGFVWGVLRILMGWTFLWAFLDKLVGLGFTTCRLEGGGIDFGCDAAFASGGAPTYGFLEFGTKASHTGSWFSWMAPAAGDAPNLIDWLFMLSLLAIGVALLLGIGVRLAGYGGALLLLFMYLAGFVWPEHNPVLDEHLIQAVLLIGFAVVGAGRWLGFGDRWARTALVRRHPILK